MKIIRFRLTVEGSGAFPIDMLRYDHCWPASEIDSGRMDRDWGGEMRQVQLFTDQHRHWQPTVDRWRSFTWRVLKCEAVP